MNAEELQAICKKLPAVTEDIKWINHLVFSVGGKMFLMLALNEYPATCSFKVSDQDFNQLPGRDGFKPAPYLARAKWIFLDDINRIGHKEWEYFIGQAYQAVKARLPKKILSEAGLL